MVILTYELSTYLRMEVTKANPIQLEGTILWKYQVISTINPYSNGIPLMPLTDPIDDTVIITRAGIDAGLF